MKPTSKKFNTIKSSLWLFLFVIILPFHFLACEDLYIENVSPEAVKKMIDDGENIILLDVREPDEYCDADGEIPDGHIPGTINMPLESGVLGENYKDLDKQIPVVVICRSGNRSALASLFLWLKGFRDVKNMEGGMKAWSYIAELEFCSED
ncbi:MAG: rhodanese-like domain-containing protein [Proteobacteria bacterium]|nr:rhodanese-like domain-containing protein [Pseudomonadota bacterium]